MKTSFVSGFGTLLFAPVVAAVLAFSTTANAATIPLLSYNFNESSGTTALNAGSLGSAGNLTMRNSLGAVVDRHGVAGSGVSGSAGDRAFHNHYGQANAASLPAINGLESLTIAGWFKTVTTDPIVAIERIFFNNQFSPTAAGFDLSFNGSNSGRLLMTLWDGTGATATAASNASFNAKQEWVFFAVTWERTSRAINFYVGSLDGPVVSAGSTVAASIGVTGTNPGNFALSNLGDHAGAYPRPYNGFLDNIALWGSQTDSSGALSQADLEAFRMSAVPEPGTMGLAALGGVLLFALRRRRTVR